MNGTILQYFHNYLPVTDDLWTSLTNRIPAKMHVGMIITYRLKTLFGMPTTWITEKPSGSFKGPTRPPT